MINPIDHFEYQVRNAVIQQWPYPHIEVHEIFPDWCYRELVRQIPDRESYKTYDDECYGTIVCDDLPDVWQGLVSDLQSDKVADIFREKFGKLHSTTGSTRFRLHKDLEGFEVSPHPDKIHKEISILIYLPMDLLKPIDDTLATHICVPKTNDRYDDGHHSWEDFNIVKSVKYEPNKLLAFSPAFETYHAVKPEWPHDWVYGKKERDVLKGFVFREKAEILV